MYTHKILLIEDNPFFLHAWNAIMSRAVHSYKLDWAVSEKAAAKLLKEQDYDVIISDIFLSGKKAGLEIWKTVNPDRGTFIFASSVEEKKFNDYIAGEDRPYLFLKKPLDIETCVIAMTHITLEGPRHWIA